MTKRFVILAAAILVTGPALAREPSQQFVHDGITYVYDASQPVDGDTLLTGHTLPNGGNFRLVVKDRQVIGRSNGHPVRFSIASSRGAADGAVTTARPTELTSRN